jgi:hypothetical protein
MFLTNKHISLYFATKEHVPTRFHLSYVTINVTQKVKENYQLAIADLTN